MPPLALSARLMASTSLLATSSPWISSRDVTKNGLGRGTHDGGGTFPLPSCAPGGKISPPGSFARSKRTTVDLGPTSQRPSDLTKTRGSSLPKVSKPREYSHKRGFLAYHTLSSGFSPYLSGWQDLNLRPPATRLARYQAALHPVDVTDHMAVSHARTVLDSNQCLLLAFREQLLFR